MFGTKHYVPILKWKAAEQTALEKLGANEKKFISPLIQFVMPQPKRPKEGEKEKTPEEQLEEVTIKFNEKLPGIPNEILSSWGSSPAFVDFSLIYTPSLRIESLKRVLTDGERLGLFLIPVVNLSSDHEFKKAASVFFKKYRRGLCLRLVHADFNIPGKLAEEIQKFLTAVNLFEKEIDLLIDLKTGVDAPPALIDLSRKVPNLLKWRTFTVASGAFPLDLRDCEIGENYIDRLDWENWINLINSKKLERSPSFSDYTIQHPVYKESLLFFSPSASIRYTLEDKWLVMRGQKGKSKQYLANARLLSQHSQFFGPDFSFGDAFIFEKGKDLKSKKTGNATNWLVAGINHHLVCTISQIANLP
ncbi:beta family protein [Candidatus Manganitrophus noduliformans]|uniref:Beta protein n=1 Tax=Candidatus Manganitrophus noduliformans TaxID=2606439 RepID=A0A7X6DTI6_9BACT|nr:beta family protein [Candidatus Manganitrophus noduliformans]NKE72982.1 hypothetical protein [Candidatus Manganitrophus noduliformans]